MLKYLGILFAGASVLMAMLWKSFQDGKQSVINKENQKTADDIENFNKTKQNNSRLSSSDLDKRMRKWFKKDRNTSE